mmetsp:Transcript_51988/g.103462  ORF Transcript_51988/g.103462 Transcript_51988/m.103462 type:complete len:215 (-) Transcript_51988:344-988(-)
MTRTRSTCRSCNTCTAAPWRPRTTRSTFERWRMGWSPAGEGAEPSATARGVRAGSSREGEAQHVRGCRHRRPCRPRAFGGLGCPARVVAAAAAHGRAQGAPRTLRALALPASTVAASTRSVARRPLVPLASLEANGPKRKRRSCWPRRTKRSGGGRWRRASAHSHASMLISRPADWGTEIGQHRERQTLIMLACAYLCLHDAQHTMPSQTDALL